MNARRAFVETLRAKRLAVGMTQRALAAALGVCNRTVNRWERHRRAPRADVAARWASVLGVRVVGGSLEDMFAHDAPCGTDLGYHRHRRRGERCQPCWAAHSRYIGELSRRRAGL